MPFTIKAIQVDGGSEFEATFEEECHKQDIRLFVLPPRSPKLNGHVERAYNTIRPHQALGYMTPLKFLEQWKENQGKEAMCH
jgi:transposase InsO family protein